jgi:hypothetical protein
MLTFYALFKSTVNCTDYTASVMNESVECIGRKILTRENENNDGRTFASATFPTTNYTWPDLTLNPGFCDERPVA